MIKIDQDNKNNMFLTWDNSWINKYESIWSIFEKIKIANNISNKEILNLFASINVIVNPKVDHVAHVKVDHPLVTSNRSL